MSYDDDNDGGLREWAETQEAKEIHWGKKDAEALKAHREWMREFESGLPLTNEKNANNETNQQAERTTI